MSTQPIKVLIVEDDSMLLEMYKMKFEGEGFAVQTGSNGVEGLQALDAGMPDIVLLDVIMPKMDGFTMLKKVKDDARFQTLPVVLLTNLGQENDVKRGMDLGATDYLVKANLTPQQVVDKVRGILNKK